MKHLLSTLCILVIIVSCKTEPVLTDAYEITGTVKGMPNGVRVFLKSTDNPKRPEVVGTAILKNEQFTFSGKTESPVSRNLTVNGVEGVLPFVLENGRITMTIDRKNIKNSAVEGSKNTQLLHTYISGKETLSKKQLELKTKLRQLTPLKDRDGYNAAKKELDLQVEKVANYTFEFIADHPNSDISLMALSNEIKKGNVPVDKVENSLKTLEDVVERYPSNRNIATQVTAFIAQRKAIVNLEIGKKAPEFSSPDADGTTKNLKDMLGKVTIIDFWASWCGPCRRENPNVVKVYEKYHDKGLEIVGVSLDRAGQKQRWLDAIKKDKLRWNHVSSLNYFNDPVAKLYAVNAIPRTYILDENGIIVGKNLRGKALENKIAELLD